MVALQIFSTFVVVLSFFGGGSCAGVTLANFTELTPPVSSKLSRSGFSRTTLFISDYPATFNQAQEYCYQIAGSFLSIVDKGADDYVRQALVINGLASGRNIWTSGIYDFSLFSYIWEGVGQRFLYSNWRPGYPSFTYYGSPICVTVIATGRLSYQYGWQSYPCSNSYRFICEI